MKFFITFDASTGAPVQAGYCLDSDFENQRGPGQLVIEAARNPFVNGALDFDAVREALNARIDTGAEETRLRFITPGAGQMMSYLQKREEARAWAADHNAQVPVIAAEAAALGKTVAAVVAEVAAAATLWVTGEAMINATRLAAKQAVTDAEDLLALHAVTLPDWQALAAAIVTGG